MDQSISKKKKLLTPEKAASFIPVLISSIISILVIIFFVMPQYYKSKKVGLELNELTRKKNELDKLKSQYKIINKKFEKLNKEKSMIIELITGKSKLETLLSRLGEIGQKNNIKFKSIIPKKLSKAGEDSAKNKNIRNLNNRKAINKLNLKLDPLLVEGTRKYEFDFSFETEFANLVAFLRELEFQDNVILIDNINIKSTSQSGKKNEIDNPTEMLEVEMRLVFYGVI